uniref:Uncharacterized protein n=1 Tax=Aegilops tauschii subsp. strangulata TaxID=200361 RepID=A0A453DE52_AEGTS
LLRLSIQRRVEREAVEAEMASRKKRGAELKKPTQGGAPGEEEQSELRTVLESASRRLGSGGGHDVKRDMLALFEASIRVASKRQSKMTDIPHFYLPEKATFADLMKLKMEKLQRYESVKSFDIEGLSPVTPPTELDTYQIIDITRPSDTDPEKAISVAQILSRETDNYFAAVRPTPDPTAAGGFFVFSNIILPWFFGKCHQMSCSSRYAKIENMQVCRDSIYLLVEEILRLDDENCKHITGYMISLLEIGMFLFGEFPRMQGPVDLLQDNFDLDLIIHLTAEVLFDMRNWSYLSKTGFAFYLGMVETWLDVIGHKETFLAGWKKMTAAVTKFEKSGHKLDLLGANGYFSLRKLVGNRLHLLKFDEEYVKRLIIRKCRQHKGRMEALKEDTNQVQLKDHEGENKNGETVEPEIADDLAWKKAKKEYEYWLSLMVEDRDMLIKVLCELNVDLFDKDQSEGMSVLPWQMI